MCYNCLAVRWSGTQRRELEKATKPVNLGSVRFKVKPFSKEFRLGAVQTESSFMGFLTSAVCKYRRDNQPNDASGSATRRRTGGNGGRIVEPVRELSSLLGQAFVPEYKDDASLRLPLSDGWLRRECRMKVSEPVMNSLG